MQLQAWPRIDDSRLEPLVDADFRTERLGAESLQTVFHDSTVHVTRSQTASLANPVLSDRVAQTRGGSASGAAAFRLAVSNWLQPLGALNRLRFDVKISEVDLQPTLDRATTRVHVTLSGAAIESGPIQQNIVWRCEWVRRQSDAPPRLAAVKVQSFEQVATANDHQYLFADCTESVLAANEFYRPQFCHGASHWCQRLEARMGVYLRSLHGVSVADVNGDGLDDLYVSEPGGLPNRLFLQNLDGSATDVSANSGVDLLEPTRSAVIADFDNDGHQDMALVMIYSAIAVFRGNGSGQFSLVQAIPVQGKAYSLTSADYDQDGRLDLFVCVYNDVAGEIGETGGGIPEPYYDANQGAANVLLHNQGELQFQDVTAVAGINVNNRRFSYAAAWEDFDNDGDQDLYVANDFGRNNLYRNDEARFVDVAAQSGVEDTASGMGVTWGDYDNDGLMDLYVANMWSSAGKRVTFQQEFPAKDEVTRGLFQRLARGNSLFRNRGSGVFGDCSLDARVSMGRWAWGTKFVDLNNDGFQDLIVANGFVTGENPEDL